jgi:hypothetical protein
VGRSLILETTYLIDLERDARGGLDELGLDETALATAGRHEQLGAVRLSHLLSTWVVHDLTHLAQIERALAAQVRDEVGPWVELLSILKPRT